MNRGIRVLQTRALPLGHGAKVWSGRRDSDPRHLPWQGNALPLSHSRIHIYMLCYETLLRINAFASRKREANMVGTIGLEPMTPCL